MTRIAIIGGGISGLSAAFDLEQRRQAAHDVEYTLYESSSRLGGVLRTERIHGCVVEAGQTLSSPKNHGLPICADRWGSATN